MNKPLLIYHLGALATADVISAQCKTVRDILFADVNDQYKIENLLNALGNQQHLETDTFNCLKRGFRGHYGGDGRVFDITPDAETNFWLTLQELFPENGHLALTAADAAYLTTGDATIYGPLFIRGMQITDSIANVGGEIGEVLLDSPYRFNYQLLVLKALFKDYANYPEDAENERSVLLAEYTGDQEKVELINAVG